MNIGIVGVGKLGICMALCLDTCGYNVYCYDTNQAYLQKIKERTLDSPENRVVEMLSKSKINVVDSENMVLENCDVVFIFIQTPSTPEGKYIHTYIDNFVNKCIENGHQDKKKVLVISSTVMPEYTDTITEKLKEYNYDVCYNPTFIAQGSIIDNLINPNIVLIGGQSQDAIQIITDIHRNMVKNNSSVHTMSAFEAEITKISINCFITTKISYANMIGDLLQSKGVEPSIVLNAIGSDDRIGNKYLKYGYGFGGPCFPRDNRALKLYANTQGHDFELCSTTDNQNKYHLIHQYNSMKDSIEPIIFDYITYKDSSDILEESQKLKLACMLSEKGCKVIIKERKHIISKLKDDYGDIFEYIEK